jgi:hypothetical protein
MKKLLNFTKWVLTSSLVVTLVLIYSCSEDDPVVIVPVEFSYAPTAVEVGATGMVIPVVNPAETGTITWSISDAGDADFITINSTNGELTIAAESTTGEYEIEVTATNSTGPSTGTASVSISANADFDLAGKNLIWKYWMNNTPDVVLYNLNLLPGQEALDPEIPIPTGWPADWPNINLADPMLPTYFVFPTVQYFLMQVPGDDACAAATNEAESGDTLLILVNNDLSLSTICRDTVNNEPGTTVDLGTSSISYSEGGFVWTMELTLQGVPVTVAVGGAVIEDFTDPLDPSWEAPSGMPRTFSAVTGNVAQYMTPTDFHPDNYLSSIQLLDVDVVLEILE